MDIAYRNTTVRLNLLDEGEGEAVLLLHGWGTSLDVYKSLISFLSPFRRVVSYDLPGFGKSDLPEFAFSTDDYAEIAFLVLKELNIERVTLIGHSHGGRTILNMASRSDCPVAIDRIVLIDSAGIVPKKTLSQKARVRYYKAGKKLLSFAPVKALFPNALDSFKRRHGSADYKAVAGVLRDSLVKIVNDDYKERMKNIQAPTLLIWGTKDDATPICDAEYMEQAIPDAGLVRVEGGSHYSFLDSPGLVQAVLRSFLKLPE